MNVYIFINEKRERCIATGQNEFEAVDKVIAADGNSTWLLLFVVNGVAFL